MPVVVCLALPCCGAISNCNRPPQWPPQLRKGVATAPRLPMRRRCRCHRHGTECVNVPGRTRRGAGVAGTPTQASCDKLHCRPTPSLSSLFSGPHPPRGDSRHARRGGSSSRPEVQRRRLITTMWLLVSTCIVLIPLFLGLSIFIFISRLATIAGVFRALKIRIIP